MSEKNTPANLKGPVPNPNALPVKADGIKKNMRQIRFLPKAAILTESHSHKLVLIAISFICAIVAFFIIWAGVTKIQETAVTYGEVIPNGDIQSIEHLEGGIVSKVFVKDGDFVKKGEVIAKLQSSRALAELEQMQSREVVLMLDMQRLRSYITGENADLKEWSNSVISSKYNPISTRDEIAGMLQDEEAQLSLQNKARNDERSVLTAQIEQRKEELSQLNEQHTVLEKHLDLLNQELAMYQKLDQASAVSKRDYLAIQRQVNQGQGDLTKVMGQKQQALQALSEAQNRLNKLNSDADETALTQIGEIHSELLTIRHNIERLQDRVKRLTVKAPVDGIVKGLSVGSGAVLQPGEPLMDIVPLTDEMVVETRINTKDIGHLKAGDAVKVKVLTYDFARYGAIPGTLEKISASTFTNETDGQPYYEGLVTLTKNYVGDNPEKNKLKPGMTVQADINTGEKTLMQYLLKPIQRTVGASFSER